LENCPAAIFALPFSFFAFRSPGNPLTFGYIL